MSDKAGVVQGPADSSGKRISNVVVVLPAGTVLTNADGSTTTLNADTPVFVQRVTLSDPQTLQSTEVHDGKLQVEDRYLHLLGRIAETLDEIKFCISALT